MKANNIFLCLFFIIIPFTNQAQVDIEIDTDKIDTVEISKYKFSGLGHKQALIRMNYSDYEIKNPEVIKLLKTKNIQSIELLFTDYPKGAEMSTLNKKRFISLYLHFPEVFNKAIINWTMVKQTGANHRNVYNFHHGFVVSWGYKTLTKRATREQKHLEDVIAGKKEVEDSTVLKVMDRNKHWKNMLIVGDFTGSMTPYIAEVLLWHKLNIERKNVNGFIFFNDGDSTSNFSKKIGMTGGLYPTDSKNFREVLETAVVTMANGDGGDSEENDVEAIIEGIKKFPECTDVVLIADNKSKVRDIELYDEITKPVKVVLCGAEIGANIEYLNIARATGGSVHTIEEDIENLIELSEGEEFSIGDSLFKIVDGKIVLVYEKESDDEF